MSPVYIDKVLRLLKDGSFKHRHLDWHSVEYWLDKGPGFVYLEDKYVSGFLSCGEGPKNIAWIHLFAVAQDSLIHNAWRSLFRKTLDYYSSWLKIAFAAIPLARIFENELSISGFTTKNNIIVFRKNISNVSPEIAHTTNQVLPCVQVDCESLLEVDHCAFIPLWQLTQEAFIAAYNSAYYCSKIVHEGKVIAYQLSTRRGTSVHLARIAVLPEFQGKGIARTLLDDLILYAGFNQNDEITVNTQSDNSRSIQLYTSKGFEQLPETFPIFIMGN